MIEPTITAAELQSDQRCAAASMVYDVRATLAKLSLGGHPVCQQLLGHLALDLSAALHLMERGGVPVPRLPTQQEMDR